MAKRGAATAGLVCTTFFFYVLAPASAEPAIVGLTTDELIACAGFPSDQMQTPAAEYWQYETSRRSGSVRQFGGVQLFNSRSTGCEATVAIKNGRVSAITLRPFGAILGGPIACSGLFAKCRQK